MTLKLFSFPSLVLKATKNDSLYYMVYSRVSGLLEYGVISPEMSSFHREHPSKCGRQSMELLGGRFGQNYSK